MERPQIQRKKCVDGYKAEWPSGLGSQAQENPQSRIRVHECAQGFESHSCQKTFWTRWVRAFRWQILSYWNINSRWQCKAKENKKIATSSVVDNRAVWNCTKKRYPDETCETRMYESVWTQIFTNGWHKPFSRLNLWIEKIAQWKGHKSKEKNVSTETRQNGRAV